MTELSKRARIVGFFYKDADPVSDYSFPFQLGELAFVAWLLIFGAKENHTPHN